MLLTQKEDPAKDRQALFAAVAEYLRKHYSEWEEHCFMGGVDCLSMEETVPAPCKTMALSPSLDEMLRNTDAGFSETLLKLIDRKQVKDADVYKKIGVSRQHFSKIRNNPHYRPNKATAVAFAVALELDLQETQDLIGRAGYTLSNSSKFDVIVRYFIEKRHYDVADINITLLEFDQMLLCN